MTILLVLLGITTIAFSFFSAAVHTLGLRALGVGIVAVRIGMGGSGLRLRWGRVPVTISPWLVGSSISAKSPHREPGSPDVPGREIETIGRLPLALINIAPFVVIILSLATTRAVSFADAMKMPAHIFEGALAPLTTAQAMIGDQIRLAGASPWQAFCRLLMLLAVFNLMPLPPLPGGHALLALTIRPAPRWPGWVQAAMTVSMVVILAILALWAFALFMHPSL